MNKKENIDIQKIIDNNNIKDFSNDGALSMVLGAMAPLKISSNKVLPKSFNDSVDSSTYKEIQDAYSNSLLGIGGKDKTEQFTKYGFQNSTMNYLFWMTLYSDSWVFRRAIDKPAQDMVRQGIELILDKNEDKTDKIQKRLNSLRSDIIELFMWGRTFGGSVLVLLTDKVSLNQMYQSIDKFINDKVIDDKSKFRAYVTDRWYGVQSSAEIVTKLSSIDFGKPEYYTITFTDGKSFRVHHSWVLRYEHRLAPKLIKKGMLQGWGFAEGNHIINELNRDEKLKNSIQSLIDKSLIEVIKMSGMRGIFMGADKDNYNQVQKRLSMVNWGRNFNSLTFLDSSDDYEMNTFPGLSGLSDILEQNMWQVAAALDMQGILFGDLKGGFSNDEIALTRYNEVIENLNEAYARPVFTKLLELFYKLEGIEQDVEFKFGSLVTTSDADRFDNTNKLGSLLSSGINDGYITTRLAAETFKKYAQQIGLDIDIDDKYLEELDKLSKEEDEDLDKAMKELDENTYNSDAFLNDLTHVSWIERKYQKKYPNLRIGWYEVDAKRLKFETHLTPSLYIFHDYYPPKEGSDAAKYSIRFSDHQPKHLTLGSIIMKPFNRSKFEREADRYITNNPELMEEIYG